MPRAKSAKTTDPVEIENEDETLARQALRSVLNDPTAPAAARAQAARTLLELAGKLGRNSEPPRRADGPLSIMSRADLEDELAAITGGHLPGITAPDTA